MTAISPSTSRLPLPSPSQPQNPISLRLYKVLSANLDDDGTKQALETLAELYAPASAKARRAKADADGEGEQDEGEMGGYAARLGAGALEEPVSVDIAARARKNLRRDVESKLAESSRQFLKAFGEVDKQLDTLQEHMGLMRARCDEAQTQLRETNEACRSLLDRAGSLREERQTIATRQTIITAFLSRFTLSADEREAITSRDVPVGSRFFAAMDKVQKIREDCRVLMMSEEGETKAGFDILTSTSAYLEQAYDKIFRWCCFEFRQMGRDALTEVAPALRESVSRLRQRQELLNEALQYLSQTRQATLLTSFMDALTRGGPGGLPRPIELHAHDPLRYVGDMLGWVHQAIAAEREFLEGLFGVQNERRMVGSVRAFKSTEEEEWIAELMDVAIGKVCPPLKTRVQQTILSQESSITSYKIANLLQFYLLTMQRTIGKDAVLSTALGDMTDLAFNMFSEAVEGQGRSLLRVPLDTEDVTVSPPLVILDHAQVLREMMTVYESSLLGTETDEELQAGFKDILDKMVDPALEMCLTTAEEKKKLKPQWDKSVFVLNTLAYLQGVLEPFRFTIEKRGVLQGLVETKVLQLIEEHCVDILADAGLAEVMGAIDTRRPNEPLSHIPAGEPAALKGALQRFSQWLSGLDVVQSPRLAQLTLQNLRTRIHHAALERLAKMYERLCEEVKKPENKYEAGSTLLGSERPFGQVRLLWQIFGLQE